MQVARLQGVIKEVIVSRSSSALEGLWSDAHPSPEAQLLLLGVDIVVRVVTRKTATAGCCPDGFLRGNVFAFHAKVLNLRLYMREEMNW
jgi:hypothetical protein